MLCRLVLMMSFAVALASCGKKTALEHPITLDQVNPLTEEGRKAIDPPRDGEGKLIEPQGSRRPTPAFKSFPLDVILN